MSKLTNAIRNFGKNHGLSRYALSDIDLIKLNIKQLGYALACDLRDRLPKIETTAPSQRPLTSRACTQGEMESLSFRHWLGELHIPLVYHRKLWEFGFVLQTLHDTGNLTKGRTGLGFGCGEEPLPSYFARCGINTTVTDLDPQKVKGMGWAETGQHTDSLDKCFQPNLVDKPVFDELVDLRFVDMNNIPEALGGYDFCWSICALEHLGSITHGLDFIKNSLKTLKPGGWAIHTTEFNYSLSNATVETGGTVLFRQKDFESLRDELLAAGHVVAPMNFDIGDGPLDHFIDMPPFIMKNERLAGKSTAFPSGASHLKLALEGIPSTCFGIAVQKRH